MAIRSHRSIPAVALAAALSAFGCEDTGLDTRIGPSSVTTAERFVSRGVSVEPARVDALAVAGARCPVHQPFLAPFNLSVRADGGSALSLNQVQMQFVDSLGVRAASRTLTRAELTGLFGGTLIPPFGVRTFPFSFPFGCLGLRTGTLTILVFAADALGRETQTSLNVSVH